MKKKLGLILMFIGAYVVLLAGLVWPMFRKLPEGDGFITGVFCKTVLAPEKRNPSVFDWVWGLAAAIVMVVGAALALKKNFLCPIGCGICVLGCVFALIIYVLGIRNENYSSILCITGAICGLVGTVIAAVFYVFETERVKKYGPTLM